MTEGKYYCPGQKKIKSFDTEMLMQCDPLVLPFPYVMTVSVLCLYD